MGFEDCDAHKIAAKMLSIDGDTGLLNADLYHELSALNRLCQNVGGAFVSRQAVALAIQSFRQRNPEKRIYGE